MKQKDIIVIVFVVIVSVSISTAVSKMFFGSPAKRQQQAEVVQPISKNFPLPDDHYFNQTAFDPTKVITIGQDNNPDPFKGSAH